MNNTYDSLVQQTFNFPQEDFKLKDDYLRYNDVDIKALIDKNISTKERIIIATAPKALILVSLLKKH